MNKSHFIFPAIGILVVLVLTLFIANPHWPINYQGIVSIEYDQELFQVEQSPPFIDFYHFTIYNNGKYHASLRGQGFNSIGVSEDGEIGPEGYESLISGIKRLAPFATGETSCISGLPDYKMIISYKWSDNGPLLYHFIRFSGVRSPPQVSLLYFLDSTIAGKVLRRLQLRIRESNALDRIDPAFDNR
jgi:hypothetical protein